LNALSTSDFCKILNIDSNKNVIPEWYSLYFLKRKFDDIFAGVAAFKLQVAYILSKEPRSTRLVEHAS
jgi:hypothetical protein